MWIFGKKKSKFFICFFKFALILWFFKDYLTERV